MSLAEDTTAKKAVKGLDNRTCFCVNLRDRLSCVACGKAPTIKDTYHRGFEYHHILPRSRGGADAVENLVLLCHDCHLAQHGKAAPTTFAPPPLPKTFACRACAASLDPQTVEMNCGWYRCDRCTVQVHLFDHFRQP